MATAACEVPDAMSESDVPPNDAQVLRTVQIIAGALMLGVIAFGVVAAVMVQGRAAGDPLLAYVAAGFAVFALVLRSLLPNLMAGAEGDAPAIYQTQTIVRYALLEGAALFNLVAYLIAAQWWSVAVAGVLLAAMGFGFPTRGKYETWLQGRRQLERFETGDRSNDET